MSLYQNSNFIKCSTGTSEKTHTVLAPSKHCRVLTTRPDIILVCISFKIKLGNLTIYNARSSGRWQAPAAVLPEGPKDKVHGHSRARRAREWPKHSSPRARRARGRAKLSAPFGACQCYYMFFTIQPKIAIFMAQFKYL